QLMHVSFQLALKSGHDKKMVACLSLSRMSKIQSIAKKWATYRQRLWNEFYDPTMRREALVNNVPDDVLRDQWAFFANYRLKPSTVYLETGKKPSKGMIKDRSFVNNETLTIVEQIELNMTQSNEQFELSPNDAIGNVLGPEHSGRVCCMGMEQRLQIPLG
ncbi:hypothetical protein HN51_028415, partial [Arachis hypogaea]